MILYRYDDIEVERRVCTSECVREMTCKRARACVCAFVWVSVIWSLMTNCSWGLFRRHGVYCYGGKDTDRAAS